MRIRTACLLVCGLAHRCLRRRAAGSGRPTANTRCRARCCRSQPDRKQATIKHEEIKGFMPAMTMPYKVQDAKAVTTSLAPGDLINATLVVVSNDAYLKDVKKVGRRAARKPPAEAPAPPAVVGIRAAEAGRAGAERDLRRPGRQAAQLRRVQGIDRSSSRSSTRSVRCRRSVR